MRERLRRPAECAWLAAFLPGRWESNHAAKEFESWRHRLLQGEQRAPREGDLPKRRYWACYARPQRGRRSWTFAGTTASAVRRFARGRRSMAPQVTSRLVSCSNSSSKMRACGMRSPAPTRTWSGCAGHRPARHFLSLAGWRSLAPIKLASYLGGQLPDTSHRHATDGRQ